MFYTISESKFSNFNLSLVKTKLDISNLCEYLPLEDFIFTEFGKKNLNCVYIPLNFKGLADHGKIEDVYCIKQEINGKEFLYKNIFLPPLSPYIKSYTVHDANCYFSSFDNNLMSKDKTILFAIPTNYKEKILIDEHVRYIANGALSLSKTIKEIELPLNIKEFDTRFRALFTVNTTKDLQYFNITTSLNNKFLKNNIDFNCFNVLIIANGVTSITYERELDLEGVDSSSDLIDNLYSRVDARDRFFDKKSFYPLLVCKNIHIQDVKCLYMKEALCMGFLKLKSEDENRFREYFTTTSILKEYEIYIKKYALSLYHLSIHKNEKNIVTYLKNFIDNKIKNDPLIFNNLSFKDKTYFIAYLITTLTENEFKDFVLTFNKDNQLFLNVFKPYILLIASRYLNQSYLNLILNIDKLVSNTTSKDKYIRIGFDFTPYIEIYQENILNKDFAIYHKSIKCTQNSCYYLSTITTSLYDLYFPKLKSKDKFANLFDNRELYNKKCLSKTKLFENFKLLYEQNILTKTQLEHTLFISYLNNREDIVDFLSKKGVKIQKDNIYLKEFLTLNRNTYNNAILINAINTPNNKALSLLTKKLLDLNLKLNLNENFFEKDKMYKINFKNDNVLLTLDIIMPIVKVFFVNKEDFFISLINKDKCKLALILLKTLHSSDYKILNKLLDYCADKKLYDISANLLEYKNKYFKHENITKVLEL